MVVIMTAVNARMVPLCRFPAERNRATRRPGLMLLRSLWEEGRPLLGRPKAFGTFLNRKLRVLAGAPGYFATAVFAVVNAASGEIRWIRAGHPAPLLLGEDGRAAEAVPMPFTPARVWEALRAARRP